MHKFYDKLPYAVIFQNIRHFLIYPNKRYTYSSICYALLIDTKFITMFKVKSYVLYAYLKEIIQKGGSNFPLPACILSAYLVLL